jgi:hypothetical protein
MHSDFHYKSSASFTSPNVDPYRLFSLQSLYHLCVCALHSSIVPIFSSTASDSRISKKLICLSAEEAVKHSLIIADLATAALAAQLDMSTMSGINGFAMFFCSDIQFKSLVAQRKLRNHGIAHLHAAMTILKEVKGNWHTLNSMVCSFSTLARLSTFNVT